MATDADAKLIVIPINEAGQSSPSGIGGKLIMTRGLAKDLGVDGEDYDPDETAKQVQVKGHTRTRRRWPSDARKSYTVGNYWRTAGGIRDLRAGEIYELNFDGDWFQFRSIGCRVYDIVKWFEGNAAPLVKLIRSADGVTYPLGNDEPTPTVTGAQGTDTLTEALVNNVPVIPAGAVQLSVENPINATVV